MTTVDRRLKISRSPDAQKVIHKLERTISILCTLKNNINSYSCEPKTQKSFEQKSALSRELDQMTKQSATVLYNLRIADKPLDDPIAYLRKQQIKFEALEKQVLDYIGRAKFQA